MHSWTKKKKLLVVGGVCIALSLLYFIPKIFGSTKYTQDAATAQKIALRDLVGRDSNANGIADWEEALWGLDPNGDGTANKAIIDAKKSEQTNSGDSTTAPKPNETKEFAQDLFSTIASLKASGNLTEQNITDLSGKIGGSVSEKVTLDDKYTITDLKLVDTSSKSGVQKYYNASIATLKKYNNKGIGQEMAVVARAENTENGAGIGDLKPISDAYLALAEDYKKIPVPAGAALVHISIVNDMINLGIAVRNMEELYSNSIIGAIGIAQYERYNKELLDDFTTHRTYFTDNGILINNS